MNITLRVLSNETLQALNYNVLKLVIKSLFNKSTIKMKMWYTTDAYLIICMSLSLRKKKNN